MSKITAASGGTTVEVATAGGDFTIDNTDADKKIVMRLGSDDANTDFEVRNNSDAVKFSVDGAGTTDVKSLSLGTAGELTITESSDDITIKNTVADKDIIFNINDSDGGGDTEVMRIRGSNASVGINTSPENSARLHVEDDGSKSFTLLLESTDTDAGGGPTMALWRNSASPANGDDCGGINWYFENGIGARHLLGRLRSEVNEVTSGSEDSRLYFSVFKAGSEVETVSMKHDEVVINDGSNDIDLRVEGDTPH